MAARQSLQFCLEPSLALADDGDLPPLRNDGFCRRDGEIDAFLMNKSRHHREERPGGYVEPEALAHVVSVGALAAEVLGRKPADQIRISARIPTRIDTVDNAIEAPF